MPTPTLPVCRTLFTHMWSQRAPGALTPWQAPLPQPGASFHGFGASPSEESPGRRDPHTAGGGGDRGEGRGTRSALPPLGQVPEQQPRGPCQRSAGHTPASPAVPPETRPPLGRCLGRGWGSGRGWVGERVGQNSRSRVSWGEGLSPYPQGGPPWPLSPLSPFTKGLA